jgi:hypothetical protein
MKRSHPFHTGRYGGSLFVAEFIHALGIVDLLATPIGVITMLAFRVAEGKPQNAGFTALLIVAFIAGITLGGLLLGMSALLRYVHTLARERERAPQARAEVDKPVTYTAPAAESGAGKIANDQARAPALKEGESDAQTLSLLREIRDLTLLPPEERRPVADRVRTYRERQAAESVIDAINFRQIAKARLLLNQSVAAYGANPTFERLVEKIQEADVRNEPLDYERTKRLVEEAIGEGNWALAEQYAHAAFNDHPDSARCRKLWDNARRARLHAHVQESANHHHWNEALAAAEEFLGRFPDSVEAEALRDQLETLRANAEIQQRKQYENRIKELIGGKQYEEALRIARHVIEHFPGSPQAEALREKVPVLEKYIAAS